MSGARPNSWNAGNSCSAPYRSACALRLPHGHHLQAAGVRAGRPADQAVDVLGRAGLGVDLIEVVDRVAGRGGDVDVGHGVLPFGYVSPDRTDVTGRPRPRHRPKYSCPVLIPRVRRPARATRSTRPRSGSGWRSRAWSRCAGRGSARSVRRRTAPRRSAGWSVPSRPAGRLPARAGLAAPTPTRPAPSPVATSPKPKPKPKPAPVPTPVRTTLPVTG